MKKIVKMVRETCKDMFLLIDLPKRPERYRQKGNKNKHLSGNYCKQQNLDFIGNSNINKSDLNSRRLHLQERGSSILAKSFLDYCI